MNDFIFTYEDFDEIKAEMMNMIYNTLVENVNDAIDNKADKTEKIKALNTILLHFEKIEHYEKCAKIKEIINSL